MRKSATIALSVGGAVLASLFATSAPVAAAPHSDTGAATLATSFAGPTPADAGRTVAARDARAAAGVSGKTVRPLVSWYSGTVAAGATQAWVWNNANPLTLAYKVGFSPVGASTTAPCQFEVTRNWYEQLSTGERKFFFNITNIGTGACATQILLSSLNAGTSWSTGGVNPGATQSWVWNNANPLNASYLVGASPTGATNTANCKFEITRTWYERLSTGERKFRFNIKNVGTIACAADIRLASTTAATSWSTGTLSAGSSTSWFWNNANPLNLVYLPGLNPAVPAGATTCQLEVTRNYYLQQINPDGTAQRRAFFTVKNVGSVACSGTFLLASIAA